jgi:hypothetical protein
MPTSQINRAYKAPAHSSQCICALHTPRRLWPRYDADDMEHIGDVRFPLRPLRRAGLLYLEKEVPLEQLSDMKAKSIIEWTANDRVRRTNVKHFRQLLPAPQMKASSIATRPRSSLVRAGSSTEAN